MNDDSNASRIEKDIESRILCGEFAPGVRLHNSSLAKEYAVAISPIREALSRLVSTGLVQFIDKKGFFVTRINLNDFLDIAQTYADIECLALEKAILRGDDAWESAIVSSIYQLSKVERGEKVNYSEWAPKNKVFHDALVSGCQSSHLLQCRNLIYRQHERYISLSFQAADKHELKANHREHKQLADLVLARKTKPALKALRAHILEGQQALIDSLRLKPES